MLAKSPIWLAAVPVPRFTTINVNHKSPAAVAAGKEAALLVRMEKEKIYGHYTHTDSCNMLRWNARESFEFMYARRWGDVVDFYANLVRHGNGASDLFKLFKPKNHDEIIKSTEDQKDLNSNLISKEKKKGGRWERNTFKIILSYHGGSFDGWQKQPNLNTVQGAVEKSLGKFVDERKIEKLKKKLMPIEGCAAVAGRTDKGVSALQQVCSFYTWRNDVKCEEIRDAINEASPKKLNVLSVSKVSRKFHPNFEAKWRRYLYIFPLEETKNSQKTNIDSNYSSPKLEDLELEGEMVKNINSKYSSPQLKDLESEGEMVNIYSKDCSEELKGKMVNINSKDICPELEEDLELEGEMVNIPETKPQNFSVEKVDQILRQLEGKLLSYKIFARDTQASRSDGPATECFMFHSRATEILLPLSNQESEGLRVMCVELVANRFLRKMVRVLVATAIREAAAGSDLDALITLMGATCRRATAPPAPPEGLCLVNVGYEDFQKESCFILD